MTDQLFLDPYPPVTDCIIETLLEGTGEDIGLAMGFNLYAQIITSSMNVDEAYMMFKELYPEASADQISGESNYSRFCEDLKILIEAGIIQQLKTGDVSQVLRIQGTYKGEQPIIASDDGQAIVAQYIPA